MHLSRRRKKRPNYGARTVDVQRGANGFGFTISGQQPCILSCIVANSPADHAGLRAGDFLISVNGISVSKITHDAVVNLIGNCVGPIRMTLAENYYSDSSDEELEVNRMVNARKPKYLYKPRTHRLYKHSEAKKQAEKHEELNNSNLNISNPVPMEDEAGPIEYKALVGYLGTIEMPKQLLPNSRLQTVCSCIRKLRQEKRAPNAILMTIFPTCLTLKNSLNQILAIYPTNRVVYIGSTTDRESRYFGLVTSAVSDTRGEGMMNSSSWMHDKSNFDPDIEISNSCHVFMVDPKIVEHLVHLKKAEAFKIACTPDPATGSCLEFPKNALYIVNLVQNMYKLQVPEGNNNHKNGFEENLGPLLANSPQPSASSNSDSGIGFRDDCGNVSDRILVVEFPAQRPLHVVEMQPNITPRPVGIDAADGTLDGLEFPLNNDHELNNIRCKNNLNIKLPNNLSQKSAKQFNDLNNIRAYDSVNIKNVLEKPEMVFLAKQNNHSDCYDRLTCRAMPDKFEGDSSSREKRTRSPCSIVSSDENNAKATEPETNHQPRKHIEDVEFRSSQDDNLSVTSSRGAENRNAIFKTPSTILFDGKKLRKQQRKAINSCGSLDTFNENLMNYKLSPKVYGLSKPNLSCEELNNLDSVGKFPFGSLQELSGWNDRKRISRNIAQSEPDVRIPFQRSEESENEHQEGSNKNANTDGPGGWASSFEKLLDDPMGLHTFAEFLKKEFSAENIYFWTACERYRRLSAGPERVAEAQRIYQQHLSVGAPEGVNVDAPARQCTEQSLQNASSTLFDQAQKQIFNLMKFDSYPRFLKSDLYRQCLTGDVQKPQLDAGLLVQPMAATPLSKLRKTLSNAEDGRRKSLLPWHRKNRSKSKDRGESEYNQNKRSDIVASSESVNSKLGVNSEIHSSKSSLTSLDLAISSNQDSLKGSMDELPSGSAHRSALCRVILSNGSTTVVQIKSSETIQQLVRRLLEKRGIIYSAFEVYTDKHPKVLDVNEPSSKLSGCEVTVEQRVVFKLDLPNKKVISVKSKYTKIIADVLRPILLKYNYDLSQVEVTLGDCETVDIYLPVTSIDESRLKIQLLDEAHRAQSTGRTNVAPKNNHKLEEITNQVFEGILQGKSDCKKPKSDKGSIKSEDWGSEHSSGILRFLRTNSGLHERKKKFLTSKTKCHGEDLANNEQAKKPLIAKLKTGVNKLQVMSSESDELVEGLTRAQRSRLEDQRGTEINFELPDFLKDNTENYGEHLSTPSRFYVDCGEKETRVPAAGPLKSVSSYENNTLLVSDLNKTANSNSGLFVSKNARIYSPPKCTSEVSSSLPSPSKQETCVKVVHNNKIGPPPPLPPKPKITPIKPPNWGQNGRDPSKSLYLEQPSSSFV